MQFYGNVNVRYLEMGNAREAPPSKTARMRKLKSSENSKYPNNSNQLVTVLTVDT